jgi:hypothetical protein
LNLNGLFSVTFNARSYATTFDILNSGGISTITINSNFDVSSSFSVDASLSIPYLQGTGALNILTGATATIRAVQIFSRYSLLFFILLPFFSFASFIRLAIFSLLFSI